MRLVPGTNDEKIYHSKDFVKFVNDKKGRDFSVVCNFFKKYSIKMPN